MRVLRRLTPRFDSTQGPVVVGGVGGSGTRLVADMMRQMGVYTGSDLNDFGDNLWFTLLCKLPRWDLDATSADAKSVAASIFVLEKAMTGELLPKRADRDVISAVVARCASWYERDPLNDDNPLAWLRERASSLRRSRHHVPDGATLWGWKEPNSHLFLPHLHRHFGSRFRYVHVIRNGVYMAHSQNQLQLRRWGSRFGIVDVGPSPSPVASLDYWIASNELAITRGRSMPPGAYLLLNYDDLCAAPRDGIAQFVHFLGLEQTETLSKKLAALPKPLRAPEVTLQELRQEFGDARIEKVREMGFSISST